MQTSRDVFFPLTVIAASLLLAAGPARGEDAASRADEMRKDIATPDNRVELGLGVVSVEGRRFSEYSGMKRDGAYGLLNLDIVNRDDVTGTWTKLKGTRLGLDNREFRFEQERQGSWAFYVEGSQLPRNEPLTVNTGLQGIGSGNQVVSSVAPKRNIDLSMDHDIFSVGGRTFAFGGFDLRVSLRQDEKHGNRMFGRGTPGAMEFLAEPIDRVTRQWEVVLGYADPKLQLSGGYNGSLFVNDAQRLNVSGGNAAFSPPLSSPALNAIGLPPSNQAHQLHLSGGYNWSDATRTSFKLSHSVARQNDTFAIAPTLAGAPLSLDGKMVSTLAYADLSTRPVDRLDVTASVRFEDRDDQTPINQFLTLINPTATLGGVTGRYVPRSMKQGKAIVEAGYSLDDGYRLVAGLEYEHASRNIPVQFRRVGYREETNETQARAEIKRTLSETINGSLAFIRSDRGGSDYVADTYVQTAGPTNQVNPLLWADRGRNKLRLTADWIPDEQWSVQFITDLTDDKYSGRNLGPRAGQSLFFSGDATYAISDKWHLTTWISQERIVAEQQTRSDLGQGPTNGNVLWAAALRNTTTAWGIGLKGKVRGNLDVGADLSSSFDKSESGISKIGGTGTANPASLPDYFYRYLSLKLFANYALEPNSGIRGDILYQRQRTDDWTWQNWVYTDGTTVSQPALQNIVFLGMTYYYRWR